MVKREDLVRGLVSLQRMTAAPFLFVLPFVFGFAAKLYRSKLWFGDFQAVACAGRHVQAHQPLYALDFGCAGMHPSVYVYIPPVARLAALLEKRMGDGGFDALYLGLFAVALFVLAFVPLRLAPTGWREKLPFAVFIGGSAIMWGNIAVILHAMVLCAALLLETAPWLFVAAVAIAATVKPVFLTYLVVIVLADMRWRRRIVLCLAGLAAGILPTALFVVSDPLTAGQWRQTLSHFVYEVTPGTGFYGWLAFAGVRGDTILAEAGYLLFAAAMIAATLTVAAHLRLNGADRLWLGLSVAVLLIPRIMSQDVFLLGPGLVIVARRAASMGRDHIIPDRRWASAVVFRGPHIVWGLCLMALIAGSVQHGRYSTPLALLGFSLYVIGLGAAVSRQRIAGMLGAAQSLIVQTPVPDPETRS